MQKEGATTGCLSPFMYPLSSPRLAHCANLETEKFYKLSTGPVIKN